MAIIPRITATGPKRIGKTINDKTAETIPRILYAHI